MPKSGGDVATGAEEGVDHELQANWLKTFCKRWKRSLKEFTAQKKKKKILKKSAGHAHREDAILE